MSPSLSVLTRNRDFRRLFVAELVVFGGDWFVLIPLLTLLTELTGSGLWGGLALAVDTAVVAALLPYAGTLADRFDRRKIMLATNLASVAAAALLMLVRSPATVWIGLLAVGLLASAKAFYSPAAQAALPNVVDEEDRPAANALAGSAWGTMLVVAASLGGVVSSRFGPYTCFIAAAICLSISATMLSLVRRPFQAARDASVPPARPFAAVAEALRYVRSRPRVAALVTVKSGVGFGNGVLAVFPLLVTVVYGAGEIALGLLFAARGLGALLGPLFMRRVLAHPSWLLPGMAISMGLYGLAYLGVAVTPWLPLTLVLVAVAHFAGGGNWVMSNVALQNEVPDELRGRIFATDMMIAMIAVSVSQFIAGALADHVDTRVVVAAFGAVTLVYAVAWRLITRRLLKRVETTQPVA